MQLYGRLALSVSAAVGSPSFSWLMVQGCSCSGVSNNVLRSALQKFKSFTKRSQLPELVLSKYPGSQKFKAFQKSKLIMQIAVHLK